jgi:hypothetical protein
MTLSFLVGVYEVSGYQKTLSKNIDGRLKAIPVLVLAYLSVKLPGTRS